MTCDLFVPEEKEKRLAEKRVGAGEMLEPKKGEQLLGHPANCLACNQPSAISNQQSAISNQQSTSNQQLGHPASCLAEAEGLFRRESLQLDHVTLLVVVPVVLVQRPCEPHLRRHGLLQGSS